MIRLFLDRPPSVNTLFVDRAKARGPKRGKFGRVPTDYYMNWRLVQKNIMIAQRQKPVAGPVAVTLTVRDEGSGDLDNCCKAALDLLVFHRLIEDDNRKIVRRITLQWGNPVWGSDKMGCLIEVFPAAEDDRERREGTVERS